MGLAMKSESTPAASNYVKAVLYEFLTSGEFKATVVFNPGQIVPPGITHSLGGHEACTFSTVEYKGRYLLYRLCK